MKNILNIILFLAVSCLCSCQQKSTDNPVEAFNFWAGHPANGVQVIHGKYWQSAHWSKEYIVYLELNASTAWRKAFIAQNHLIEVKEREGIPADAPKWFTPKEGFRKLIAQGFSPGSVYYEDPITGHMFIYEIQL